MASLHGKSGSIPFLQGVTAEGVEQPQGRGKPSIHFVRPTKSSCFGAGADGADGAEDVAVSEIQSSGSFGQLR